MCKARNVTMAKYQKKVHLNNKVLYELVTTKNSCVEVQKNTKHITLFPYHLNNIISSIKEILNVDIGKFSRDLGGILLGYKNIKLMTSLGSVNFDSCFIHLDIEADFVIFKPVPGKELPGVVTKKSKDHVGCLVYHMFNVSLPKPEEIDSWTGNDVEIGQEVVIRVTYVNLEGKLPYIKAEFLSNISEMDCSQSREQEKKRKNKFSDSDGEVEEQVKKKRRKKISQPKTDSEVE